ncbi:MAG: polysaccharide deacetylase family protein [Peptococcaceae bacterium]
MKKKILYLPLIFVSILILIIDMSFTLKSVTVYKDRDHWEKTGKIIWEVQTEKKVVALTFDDGPSPTFTPQVLEILKKYDAKGSFFVIGKQAEKFPEIVIRTALQGHTIGNHMHNHQTIIKIAKEDLIKDLSQAHQLIFRLTGQVPQFFRPPDGYYDQEIVDAAEALNYKIILWTWTQDTRDWSGIPADTIAQKIIKNITPGDIILFHDQGGDRSNTVKALEIVLPALKEKGYRFITVEEMLKIKNASAAKN